LKVALEKISAAVATPEFYQQVERVYVKGGGGHFEHLLKLQNVFIASRGKNVSDL